MRTIAIRVGALACAMCPDKMTKRFARIKKKQYLCTEFQNLRYEIQRSHLLCFRFGGDDRQKLCDSTKIDGKDSETLWDEHQTETYNGSGKSIFRTDIKVTLRQRNENKFFFIGVKD